MQDFKKRRITMSERYDLDLVAIDLEKGIGLDLDGIDPWTLIAVYGAYA